MTLRHNQNEPDQEENDLIVSPSLPMLGFLGLLTDEQKEAALNMPEDIDESFGDPDFHIKEN